MDNPTPDLSPDIEWMLESGQVRAEILAEALVREYFQPIYRFGLATFRDSRLAKKLAIDSLGTALIQSYTYHGGNILSWLLQIVIRAGKKQWRGYSPREIHNPDDPHSLKTNKEATKAESRAENDDQLWEAIEKISRKNRLPFLLTYLYHWPPELVAETLQANPKTISDQLKSVRRQLIGTLKGGGYPFEDLEDDRLNARIRRLMESHWPDVPVDSGQLDEIITMVTIAAEQQQSRRLNLASVKELILVAAAVILVAGLIYGGNMLFPEPESATPQASTALITRIVAVVASPTPTPTPQPTETATPTFLPPLATLQPLTLQSSSDQIRERIHLSHFAYQTLWMDGLVSFYGPEGYAGAPQAYRIQIWIDNTIPAGIILGGAPGANAEEIGLSRSGIGYWSEIDGIPPFKVRQIIDHQSLRSWYGANLLLYQAARLGDSGTYRITGREALFGRDSLIVDYINLAGQKTATLWVDPQTGLALRQRYFVPSTGSTSFDIRLLDIAINPDIPGDLFNPEYPWTGTFAKNASNQANSQAKIAPNFYLSALKEMKPVSFSDPPPGFDPGSSQLYFQISIIYYENPVPDSLPTLYQASVFTDDYFLGDIEFENPWGLICDRSSDGRRLAIAGRSPAGESRLHLFDLSNLAASNGRSFFNVVTQFAFAPDNHRLAVFASHEPYGSVYILDTDNDQLSHLIDLPDARSFVWSPDGKYLAMIGRVNQPIMGDEVIVVRTDNGNITYRKSVDYGGGNIGDWPPLEWGIDFPIEMDGLAQCAASTDEINP